MLGEYDSATVQETVYLDGLPVLLLMPGAVHYIDADQLGTPRQVRNATGQALWRWESDAFGTPSPNEDPDGTGKALSYNLRIPEQLYDEETGLHYNWNRYYDPATGRYTQSDPIGLAGGVNTYGYVNGNPISLTDPTGLDPFDVQFNRAAGTLWITPPGSGSAQGFPAANNAQSSSRGPWPPGTYPFERTTTHSDDGSSSQYGSNGNTIFTVPGRSNMGVHSGRDGSTDRAGRSGAQYATDGCIRTTDDATTLLRNLLRQGHTPTVVVTD
ncbi:RHS repeat-associated core domain-containing protein [Hydrogenophaga sp. OTU3427]|uniref:RHS repeat-associated core domain-containing protein n=1 Tax=Hydrogenophaga sp. OTU3427 TaxID=3043856 RepID=UPI00313B3894